MQCFCYWKAKTVTATTIHKLVYVYSYILYTQVWLTSMSRFIASNNGIKLNHGGCCCFRFEMTVQVDPMFAKLMFKACTLEAHTTHDGRLFHVFTTVWEIVSCVLCCFSCTPWKAILHIVPWKVVYHFLSLYTLYSVSSRVHSLHYV